MLIALAGWMAGYKGDFDFGTIGKYVWIWNMWEKKWFTDDYNDDDAYL